MLEKVDAGWHGRDWFETKGLSISIAPRFHTAEHRMARCAGTGTDIPLTASPKAKEQRTKNIVVTPARPVPTYMHTTECNIHGTVAPKL